MHTLEQIKAMQGKIASESHGEAVFEKITETIKEGNGRGRWFWELLQNAMDAVQDTEKVSVELIIDTDRVTFRHNGNPFHIDEILKLITQGSSKKEAHDKRGRFGTGFVSTYLLSRRVEITGILDDDTRFSFLLDREAGSIAEFIVKQESCLTNFVDSFTPASGGRETSFCYLLDNSNRAEVEMGVRRIDEIIPFVLAFNEKLENIKISYEGNVRLYERQQLDRNGQICNLFIIVNKEKWCSILSKAEGRQWQVAYKLEYIDRLWSFSDTGTDFPNLFLSFPLLGTEVMGFPIVIHSSDFDVKQERTGVYLGTGNDPGIVRNKEIIEAAVRSIPELVEWGVSHSVGKLYNAIGFRTGGVAQWLDQNWLQLLKSDMLNILTQIPIVSTCKIQGRPIPVVNAFIPFDQALEMRVKISEYTETILPDKLPKECEPWYSFCTIYKELMKIENEVPDFFFTFSSLCSNLELIGSLEKLEKKLQGEVSPEQWLQRFYETLVIADKRSLFSQFAIIPTLTGPFTKLLSGLRIDRVGDKRLLEIALVHMPDLLTKLVPSSVTLPKEFCDSLTQSDLVGQLMTYFSALQPEDYFESEPRLANVQLLKWLIDTKETDRIRAFPVVTWERIKDDEYMYMHFLQSFLDKKQKLLAPIALWKEKYPRFAEMLRGKDALDDDYLTMLTSDDFSFLAEMGLIYLKPLVRYLEPANQRTLSLLLKDSEQLNLLVENDSVVLEQLIEYTDFAYLGSSDDQLLSSLSVSNTYGNNRRIYRSSIGLLLIMAAVNGRCSKRAMVALYRVTRRRRFATLCSCAVLSSDHYTHHHIVVSLGEPG